MYFSKAVAESAREVKKTHDELRTTLPGVDKAVVGGLFGDDMGDQYDDIIFEMNLGSALASRDFMQVGWSVFRKTTVSPAINTAVAGLITTSWYSLKYPVIGGALQWGAGLPLIGGSIGAWFGPPAALTGAAPFAIALAALYPANKTVKGLKKKRARKLEIRFAKVAIPVLVATAEADGNISVEELRLLRDVLQSVPRTDSFNARDTMESLIGEDAGSEAKHMASKIKLKKKQQDKVLRLGILMALTDNYFDGREKGFLRDIASNFDEQRQNLFHRTVDKFSSSQEFQERADELEEEVETELHLAEAGLRFIHAIALGDGKIEEDSAELLDMTLMNLVGSEEERQRLVSLLDNETEPNLYSLMDLLHPFSDSKTGLLTRLDPRKECDRERAVDFVVDQGIAFVHTLEAIREKELPYLRTRLRKFARRYGVDGTDIEKRRKKYAKELEKTQNRRRKHKRKTDESECPSCGEVGNFEISEKRLLTRSEYQCANTDCKQKTLLCRMPKCSGMAIAGDFYSRGLCPEHAPLGN